LQKKNDDPMCIDRQSATSFECSTPGMGKRCMALSSLAS
jgi:hypothetical protein